MINSLASGCYLILMGLTFGNSSILVILLTLELMSWLLTTMLPKSQSLKYLLIQTLVFFGFVFSLIWFPMGVIFIMLLKMGLPPFHLWFFNMATYLDKNLFVFMTTVHKLAPLLLLLKASQSIFLIFIGSSVLIFSSYMIISLSNLSSVLINSSMIHSSWMFLGGALNNSLFYVYWVLYSLLVFLLFYSFYSKKMTHFLNYKQSTMTSLLWMLLSGLPPFTMFWLKVLIISTMLLYLMSMSWVILLISVISLVIYYRMFHLTLTPSYTSNTKLTNWLTCMFLIVFILSGY